MNAYIVTLTKDGYVVHLEIQAWNKTLAKQEALQIQGRLWQVRAIERAFGVSFELESERPADEDRAGGRNTLTRRASGDLAQ